MCYVSGMLEKPTQLNAGICRRMPPRKVLTPTLSPRDALCAGSMPRRTALNWLALYSGLPCTTACVYRDGFSSAFVIVVCDRAVPGAADHASHCCAGVDVRALIALEP